MRRIAVCIKQIPLVEDANFDPVTKTIRRDGANVARGGPGLRPGAVRRGRLADLGAGGARDPDQPSAVPHD